MKNQKESPSAAVRQGAPDRQNLELEYSMRREHATKRILYLRETIQNLENDLSENEKLLENPDLDEEHRNTIRRENVEFEARLAPARNELAQMEEYLQDVNNTQKNMKYFDKSVVFQNIRELIKHKDVTLGSIEKAAGIQPGYMSRLEKPNNTTDPTAEFIVAAAQMLDIPIDLLVKTKISSLSPGEQKTLQFLQSIIEDTREARIIWTKDPASRFENHEFTLYNRDTGDCDHPLFTGHSNYDYSHNPDDFYFTYNTKFFPHEEVYPADDSYHAMLPGTDVSIYLMSCKEYEEPFDIVVQDFFEIYFIDKEDTITPVCCSAKSTDPIRAAIQALYTEIGVADKHAHLSPESQSIIDSYFNFKNKN